MENVRLCTCGTAPQHMTRNGIYHQLYCPNDNCESRTMTPPSLKKRLAVKMWNEMTED